MAQHRFAPLSGVPPQGRATTTAASGGQGRAALWRALGYLRGCWPDTLGAFAALLLVSAANLVTPQMIRLAIDGGLAGSRPDLVKLAVGGLIAAALVRGVSTFLQGYLSERASQSVAFELRDGLFEKIQRLSFSYHDQAQTGQLITRVTNDVEQVRQFVGQGAIQMVAAAIMLLGTVVVLVGLNWRLTLAALLAILPIFWLLARFVGRIAPLFQRLQQALAGVNTVLQEDLTGIRVIRSFGREAFEGARYRQANDVLLERNLTAVRMLAGNFPLVFFFASLATLVVVGYGGTEVIGGRLSLGELIAFNSYIGLLLFPIITIGMLAASISRAQASAIRIFEILDAVVEIQDAPGARALPPVRGEVRFEQVSFRYPGSDRDVLHEISFRVKSGQMVALLGTTGSGKSTLVNLVPRFYDATRGAVCIDGHDVRSVTLDSLRSQVGIVLQDALLFSGSVRDNIAYGRPDATDEDIQAAARDAQADEFIQALPGGYATLIGERGIGLSGGQRQRLAIARALLIDPRLLILDDSTSAVDAETEAAIQQALDRLMRSANRTSLVIAQRISTVRDAGLILVLDQGRIAASGTHEELLLGSELYNEILGSQLRPDRSARGDPPPDSATPGSPALTGLRR